MELVHAPVVEPQGFAGGHVPLPESVWVNGKELTVDSRVRDLQDACNYLGLNASGAKKKLYDRLAKYVEVQYQKDIGVTLNSRCVVLNRRVREEHLKCLPIHWKLNNMRQHIFLLRVGVMFVFEPSQETIPQCTAQTWRENQQGFHTFSLIGCSLDNSAPHW